MLTATACCCLASPDNCVMLFTLFGDGFAGFQGWDRFDGGLERLRFSSAILFANFFLVLVALWAITAAVDCCRSR
jgi:hypothetical protein